jgi:hypothetical protein
MLPSSTATSTEFPGLIIIGEPPSEGSPDYSGDPDLIAALRAMRLGDVQRTMLCGTVLSILRVRQCAVPVSPG